MFTWDLGRKGNEATQSQDFQKNIASLVEFGWVTQG
jgi:hypothetical protein